LKLDIIYNEDCIEGMKNLPDESIDLIVTDPPYFLTNRSGVGFMNLTWDSISDKIKLLWLNNEFVRFAEKFFISLPQEKNGEEEFIAQESVNMKELNKTIEKQENVQFAEVSLKLQNLLQKDFAQGIVITKQEVLDLLKEWCGNHINDTPLLNGAEKNALYVVPLSLLKNEVKNSVHANVTKKIKVRKCRDKKIRLTLTDALKINDALEDIIGNKSERLSIQEIIILAKFAGNTAEEKKFNVTISENIKKPEIIRHLTLLLCALYAMQKQTTIPNIIIENFFKIIFLEALRVLKPGAFAFVMCIPRQDCLSRMIISLEEAGFNVGFTSLYHCFAQGFPKAMNISKMVDKRGATTPDDLKKFKKWFREQIDNSPKTQQQINNECGFTATSYYKIDGKDYWTSAFPTPKKWKKIKEVMNLGDEWDWIIERYDKKRGYLNKPTGGLHGGTGNTVGKFTGKQLKNESYSKEAKALDGSYAGFQPKPALEVILVAMKPLSEKTYVDQALKNRKGITWLDDGRIPFKREDTPKGGFGRMGIGIGKPLEHQKYEKVIIHNAPAGTFAGGEQNRGSYKDYRENTKGRFPANLLVSDDVLNDGSKQSQGHWSKTKTTGYGKFGGGKSEYSGVGRKEPYIYKGHRYKVKGFIKDHKLQALSNYDDCGSFSRYFSIDAWWNEKIKNLPDNIKKTFPFLIVPKASKSEKNRGCEDLEIPEYRWNNKGNFQQIKNRKGNFHPTVKPIKLASYLITIGSRRGDIILDPFAGSGTTLISAKMLGRKYIGYEINPEYYEIAKRRIASISYQEEFNFDS